MCFWGSASVWETEALPFLAYWSVPAAGISECWATSEGLLSRPLIRLLRLRRRSPQAYTRRKTAT
jgi:hypothetical protein